MFTNSYFEKIFKCWQWWRHDNKCIYEHSDEDDSYSIEELNINSPRSNLHSINSPRSNLHTINSSRSNLHSINSSIGNL